MTPKRAVVSAELADAEEAPRKGKAVRASLASGGPSAISAGGEVLGIGAVGAAGAVSVLKKRASAASHGAGVIKQVVETDRRAKG